MHKDYFKSASEHTRGYAAKAYSSIDSLISDKIKVVRNGIFYGAMSLALASGFLAQEAYGQKYTIDLRNDDGSAMVANVGNDSSNSIAPLSSIVSDLNGKTAVYRIFGNGELNSGSLRVLYEKGELDFPQLVIGGIFESELKLSDRSEDQHRHPSPFDRYLF